MNNRFFERSGMTGHLFEEELFGTVENVEWDGGYVPFNKSLHMVIDHQPDGYDPTDPDRESANNLHAQTALALGLEDFSELKLYTAVGSPLDRYHGVDAFMKFKGMVITFDATLDKRKKVEAGDAKADFILTEDDVDDKFKKVAEEVAGYIKAKIKENGETKGDDPDEASASVQEMLA